MNPDAGNGGVESSAEIELHGLSIYTHHGVTDAEQEVGQRLEFDISFDVPDCDAMFTDRLEDTVNYSEVCDIVAFVATERSYRTLERLAHVVGERLIERYGCESVRVRAAKPEPPLPLAIQEVAVEITQERAVDDDEPRRIEHVPERTGYLGLGSNIGDSEGHLRAALHLLPTEGVQILAISSTYVTEPVGEILDQPDFLNAAVRIRTALEPEQLLDACKAVEAERGRHFDLPRHSPRPLDVDLLLLDDLELETDRLTLPHPQVRNRRFVLAPLVELDPDLTLPDGTVLADALAALPDHEQRAECRGPLA